MRSAGKGEQPDTRGPLVPRNHLPSGQGWFAVFKAHHLLWAVRPVTDEWQIDLSGILLNLPPDLCHVGLFRFPPLKLETKVSVSLSIHGQHHHTGGIHIQPMDNPRLWIGLLRAGLDAIRMLQGFTWDTQQSAWLINHQKIRIRVENGQKRLSRRIVDKRSWGGLVHARLIAGFAKNKRRGKCRAFQNPNQMEPIKVL